jgi:hypothetical protein
MEKIKEKSQLFNPENLSLRYGVFSGIAICIYLLLIQLSQNDNALGLKYGMYAFLFVAITFMLYKISKVVTGSIFKLGILSGIKLSTIAAIFVVLINLIVYLIAPEYTFAKYGLIPNSLIQVLSISAILFVEIFVAGNIITFINMQYFKRNSNK